MTVLLIILELVLFVISIIVLFKVPNFWIKSLACVLCSFCIVITIAFNVNKINFTISPIQFNDTDVEMYSYIGDGSEKETDTFSVNEVTQVTLVKQESDTVITVVAKGKFHVVNMNSWYFQWSLRNELIKKFGSVLTDSTV